MSFTSDTAPVAPDGTTGPIQIDFHDENYMVWDQTRDDSFNASFTSYAPWTHVTLYQNGVLVWGTEP